MLRILKHSKLKQYIHDISIFEDKYIFEKNYFAMIIKLKQLVITMP